MPTTKKCAPSSGAGSFGKNQKEAEARRDLNASDQFEARLTPHARTASKKGTQGRNVQSPKWMSKTEPASLAGSRGILPPAVRKAKPNSRP